jgi:hypothetical protein
MRWRAASQCAHCLHRNPPPRRLVGPPRTLEYWRTDICARQAPSITRRSRARKITTTKDQFGVGPTTVDMKIYASLDDHIGEGFVWLQRSGLPTRCVVKISNPDSKRAVFCEILQLEENFLKRYNQAPRYTIKDPASSIVMSAWYRIRLGSLETQRDYALEVILADSWCGKIRVCMHHPQIVVRVAVWLGVVSVALGALGVILGVISVWPRGGPS